MVSKALTTFDYEAVDGEAKGKLIYLAAEIKKTVSQHQKSGLAIGESVAQAHAILAGEGRDGQFANWVETECGFSRTTAYNYMWTWGRFAESQYIDRYEPAALYLLASPKVPVAAVKEAEKMASKGHLIRLEDAKELKEKHTVKQTSVQPLNTSAKPQASATGTPATSTASSPDLPSVGTVNRTESGSQGSGDAGECPKEDYGKCPNCAGTKWTEDIEFGVVCSRCSHPHGEPAGEVDDQRKTDARSKTIKTAEALMRAFDDLNLLASHPKEHANAIATCKILLKTARDWR